MGVARQLYQLQVIDLEIAERERKISQLVSQLGKNDVIVAAQQKLSAEQKKLEELKHQQRSVEWEIDDLVTKIKAGDEQLYSGRIKNPKELANLHHEVELLKAKRDQLETKDLEIMDQAESVAASLAALHRELAELTAEWQHGQQQLAEEKVALENNLHDLKQKRQASAAEIDRPVVVLYEKLRENKGQCVARVEQGICRGCRISLPSSDLQQARSGNVVQCGSCGRILFLP